MRAPESEHCMKALEKPGIVRAGEFLDPIEADKRVLKLLISASNRPMGCFSLKYSPCNTLAIVRSFYWPGSYFYHSIGTGAYGSFYYGNGLPNVDIQFML